MSTRPFPVTSSESPESGENRESLAVGQYVEIAADDEPFVAGPDPLDKRNQCGRLLLAGGRVALAGRITQAMHVGDGQAGSVLMAEDADAMGVPRPRMFTPAIGGKPAMHEVQPLGDDRMRFAHEGRQPEFGGNGAIAVKQLTSRCRAEEAVVAGQGGADLCKQIGALRQLQLPIPIDRPSLIRPRRPQHLLQAQHIRIGPSHIVNEGLVQPAAPGVQRNDAQ